MDKYKSDELNNGYCVDLYLDGEAIYALLNEVTSTAENYGYFTGVPLEKMQFAFRLMVNRKNAISLQDRRNCKEAMSINFIGITKDNNEKNNVEVQGNVGNSGW